MDEQRKWFLGRESTSGEDSVDIVEITTNYLEYYINLIDKAAVGFERTDSNSERSSTADKMLSNIIACYRDIVCKGSINRCSKLHCLILRNCQSPLNLISQHHQHQGKTFHQQNDHNSLKAQMMAGIL